MNQLAKNIKLSNGFKTVYTSRHMYSKLLYCDKKNKICIGFTPRGGCSISFQLYLDLLGLLSEALTYNSFIHNYRTQLFNKYTKTLNIKKLIGYTFIKFIMNPYIRAVSIYRAQTSCNLSFRNYLKQINLINFNQNDRYHVCSQYITGEDKIPFKYIKIDENQCITIKLANGEDFIVDVNKYNSVHHGKRINSEVFCGDILRETVNNQLPTSYKFFYDDEIKNLVYKIYKQDIEFYNFSFF